MKNKDTIRGYCTPDTFLQAQKEILNGNISRQRQPYYERLVKLLNNLVEKIRNSTQQNNDHLYQRCLEEIDKDIGFSGHWDKKFINVSVKSTNGTKYVVDGEKIINLLQQFVARALVTSKKQLKIPMMETIAKKEELTWLNWHHFLEENKTGTPSKDPLVGEIRKICAPYLEFVEKNPEKSTLAIEQLLSDISKKFLLLGKQKEKISRDDVAALLGARASKNLKKQVA